MNGAQGQGAFAVSGRETRKLVGVTQRVDTHPGYGERRDALDQRWSAFLETVGVLPVPLPNHPGGAAGLLRTLPFAGFVLTGGNDLSTLPGADDVAPEREACERAVLEHACAASLPVAGVCRGMQFINTFFGGGLEPCSGHVASRHPVHLNGGTVREVNSYHRYAVVDGSLAVGLEAVAGSADGVVEAVRHRELPVVGIMWHPERETPFAPEDIELFRSLFQCK